MEIPEFMVEAALGVASAIGLGGFSFLQSRSASHDKALLEMSKDVDDKFAKHTNEFKEVLKELGNNVIYIKNCDDKQELWESKFAAMMESNRLQHQHIIEKMESMGDVTNKQLEDMFEKLEELERCMRQLQKKKDCD